METVNSVIAYFSSDDSVNNLTQQATKQQIEIEILNEKFDNLEFQNEIF